MMRYSTAYFTQLAAGLRRLRRHTERWLAVLRLNHPLPHRR